MKTRIGSKVKIILYLLCINMAKVVIKILLGSAVTQTVLGILQLQVSYGVCAKNMKVG